MDGQSIEEFETDLKGNLYKIWNRMSSGTYMPPAVLGVEIPKSQGGGTRMLGVPTVADRIAQTVAAARLEQVVEPLFHPDSYGYRPGRGALDAVGVCRRRCWEFDWVIDLDVRKFFDSVRWDLIVKAVEAHTDHQSRWVVLYVKRWLAAPLQQPDGSVQVRDRGTPQGSAISPVLANLFMHYAFDTWLVREFPTVRFERYADDAVIHCRTERQASTVLVAVAERMAEVGLELHPDKTTIVYLQGQQLARSFLPAISPDALKRISAEIRSLRLHRWVASDGPEIARFINPKIRGWMAYYGAFSRSALYPVLYRINTYLLRWIKKKYKTRRTWKKALQILHEAALARPRYFAHWAWVPPGHQMTRTTRAV